MVTLTVGGRASWRRTGWGAGGSVANSGGGSTMPSTRCCRSKGSRNSEASFACFSGRNLAPPGRPRDEGGAAATRPSRALQQLSVRRGAMSCRVRRSSMAVAADMSRTHPASRKLFPSRCRRLTTSSSCCSHTTYGWAARRERWSSSFDRPVALVWKSAAGLAFLIGSFCGVAPPLSL
jgi:hypothetical protein